MPKHYKRYHKDLGYSYTLGIFLTIELLENKTNKVIEVLLKSNTKKSQGIEKIKTLCQKYNIPYKIDDKTINKLSSKENCYAIGVFHTYNDPINNDDNHLLLVNPS